MLIWLWALPALFLLLDALRVRGRVAAIPELSPSDEPVSPEHRFIVAPGVTLDEATRRAASAHARAANLGVLDLVPRDLRTLHAWGLLQFLDPVLYRADILGKGLTSGHAALVTADVLERARPRSTEPADALAFVHLVTRLKWYASTSTDLAIAPSLHAHAPTRRLAVLREQHGGGADFVLIGMPFVLAVLALAALTGGTPGFAVLVAFHLQPFIAFAGRRLRPPDLVPVVLFRTVIDLWSWIALLFEDAPRLDPQEVSARRPEYDRLIKGGIERFFEPRIERCPLCAASDLRPNIRVGDLLQGKPGRFTVERCRACGHTFQNPRLSIEGLGFYYKDFYDGLGGDDLEAIFGASRLQYLQRAELVQRATAPARWLDVGGGHGHFCRSARTLMAETRFDALDLSESIEDAERRGWVDKGYRGLFPDLASELAGGYDVVSMSHYLEHTRAPEEEIIAAGKVLSPGGYLMIEVPDPEYPLARLFGRFWLPLFQPQHQHLLSVSNLDRLLVAHGFTALEWHRGRAHQRVDFIAAVILFVHWLAPKGNVPWRPPSALRRFFRNLCFVLATPWLIAGRIADALVGRLVERLDWSNTYRVLARKGEGSAKPPT